MEEFSTDGAWGQEKMWGTHFRENPRPDRPLRQTQFAITKVLAVIYVIDAFSWNWADVVSAKLGDVLSEFDSAKREA